MDKLRNLNTKPVKAAEVLADLIDGGNGIGVRWDVDGKGLFEDGESAGETKLAILELEQGPVIKGTSERTKLVGNSFRNAGADIAPSAHVSLSPLILLPLFSEDRREGACSAGGRRAGASARASLTAGSGATETTRESRTASAGDTCTRYSGGASSTGSSRSRVVEKVLDDVEDTLRHEKRFNLLGPPRMIITGEERNESNDARRHC